MNENAHKGIFLEQNKEPLLSKGIKYLDRLPVQEQLFRDGGVLTNALTVKDLVVLAHDAHIIDESDGVPLWKKLAHAARNESHALIVDALDDEPYISSQLCIALWMSEELEKIITLIKNIMGISYVAVEIYKNLTDVEIKIPSQIGAYRVRRVGGMYPAEKRTRAGEEHTLKIGACALIHFYRAIEYGRKQTTAFVSVAGDSIANPANYELPLGCTVQQVLDAVGTISEPKRLVIGGSMTGVGVEDPEKTYIRSETRGILGFAEQFQELGLNCIGCGRCVSACPQGISPYFIYKLVRAHRSALAARDAADCTCCGSCSYVCPAKLDLSHIIFDCASRAKVQPRRVRI